MGRYRDPRAAHTPPAGIDPQLEATAAEMGQEMPYGWRWEVFRDGLGLIVCAAWREVPEWVCLESRSPGDLADEIDVYLDGLQASLEIAQGRGGRMLEPGHGAPS